MIYVGLVMFLVSPIRQNHFEKLRFHIQAKISIKIY